MSCTGEQWKTDETSLLPVRPKAQAEDQGLRLRGPGSKGLGSKTIAQGRWPSACGLKLRIKAQAQLPQAPVRELGYMPST